MDARPGYVVVVSRDADVCDLYVQIFRFRRTAVVGANDVSQVLTLAATTPVAAVLFDVLVPDDWEGCRRVVNGVPNEVPVVVLTAWVAENRRFRRLAEEIGCAAFISKPCSPELVVATVARVRRGERGIELLSTP